MGAINITAGQLGIGANKYSGLCELGIPGARGNRIVHTVSKSTTFPTKELGHIPGTLTGKIRNLSGTSLTTFIGDVRTQTSERKISFLLGSVECYVYAYSGDVDPPVCVNATGLPSPGDRKYEVTFSFPCSRSKVYKASDDSTLWGS